MDCSRRWTSLFLPLALMVGSFWTQASGAQGLRSGAASVNLVVVKPGVEHESRVADLHVAFDPDRGEPPRFVRLIAHPFAVEVYTRNANGRLTRLDAGWTAISPPAAGRLILTTRSRSEGRADRIVVEFAVDASDPDTYRRESVSFVPGRLVP